MTDYRGGPALTSPVLLNHCELMYGRFFVLFRGKPVIAAKVVAVKLSYTNCAAVRLQWDREPSWMEPNCWQPHIFGVNQLRSALQCIAVHCMTCKSRLLSAHLPSSLFMAFFFVFFKWSETKMWQNSKGVLSVSTYLACYFIIAIIYKVPFCKTVWCNAHQKICGNNTVQNDSL